MFLEANGERELAESTFAARLDGGNFLKMGHDDFKVLGFEEEKVDSLSLFFSLSLNYIYLCMYVIMYICIYVYFSSIYKAHILNFSF
tara:strand:+ start:48 stop:308 length:261 start_codon:yes stop_codon:yes gene_type:complete